MTAVLEQQEPIMQQRENFNPTEQRETLFRVLRHVLAVSLEKFDKEKASNADRQKWAHIICTAIQTYGNLLKDSELEELA
jgi:hypothetical protein